VDGRLRLYPNPTAQRLRERLARLHRCRPDNIIVGNGSDELLAMAVRAFVDPTVGQPYRLSGPGKKPIRRSSKSVVQFFTPSYSLYPVLADIHGAARNAVPLRSDFTIPSLAELQRARRWDFRAALSLVTTPNAPSGRGYSTAQLEELCRAQKGVVVLDEAYVDFARENALAVALKYPHVLVARTFSKAYSLCFQRVGYFVGHPDLIAALHKIRDSYNVNGLGQVAAMATLDDLPRYRANFRRIVATANTSAASWRSSASGSSRAKPISSLSARPGSLRRAGCKSCATAGSSSAGSVTRLSATTFGSPSARRKKPPCWSTPPRQFLAQSEVPQLR